MGFTERIHPISITITWFGQNTLANVVLGAGIEFPPLALVKNLFPKTTHHGRSPVHNQTGYTTTRIV